MVLLSTALAFFTGFGSAWYWQRRLSKSSFDKAVNLLISQHEKAFEELINQFNHEGPIPHGASVVGLIGLILSANSRAITSLKDSLSRKDWNTQPAITELEEITQNELRLLQRKFADFLESRRGLLREFDKHQGLK